MNALISSTSIIALISCTAVAVPGLIIAFVEDNMRRTCRLLGKRSLGSPDG